MSKFNKRNTIKTVNICGNPAYKTDGEQLLTAQALTTFFNEDKFYGDTSDLLIKTAEKVASYNAQYVCNLAAYARKEMHLRSVSHVLTAVLAYAAEGKPYVKQAAEAVVERPDDITEILAFYLDTFGKPVPNSLKKALGQALGKFNAFQISKYNGGSKAVKFKDVLRICHPAPKNSEQDELFKMILTDTLPVAERWETEVSQKGNNRETWKKLIAENRLGYMAILRNLRNIINADTGSLQIVLDKIQDREQALKSKQLPFRFMTAYREVEKLSFTTNKVLDALEKAAEYSVENMPRLGGKTVVAIDTSSSMMCFLSAKSDVRYSDTACLLGALAARLCGEYVVYTFDSELKTVTFPKNNGILSSAKNIAVKGGCTYMNLVFEKMIKEKVFADRLIILSDNQVNYDLPFAGDRLIDGPCQKLAEEYRKKVNPELWVHAVDLAGYGTTQFLGNKTNILAGWSERLLEFIKLSEEGLETQTERIANYGKV